VNDDERLANPLRLGLVHPRLRLLHLLCILRPISIP
jgi:hypothetical protein